jgi:hypothetical protein
MRLVIAVLVVLAGWMAFILYMLRPLQNQDRLLFGGFFLAIGVTNVLFCKTSARKLFAKTQAGPPFVASVWGYVGQKGVQVLFLGIGIIFFAAGCVVVIVGTV